MLRPPPMTSPRRGSGTRREFARGRPRFGRCGRELTKSSLKVARVLDDVVESSARVYQRFVGKFVGSSLTGCRELTERMLGVHREFTEGDRELARCSPEGCREFAERSINGYTTKIVISVTQGGKAANT
ncbi:hypothetical protein B296_00041032 [Ensete ventricosum]|uniref:Uncharacterized protein n=1 Tax=Ensete ventricosum TaxID=4639 RepID=A0A426ZDZ4_ENSVE|nr:hypothetical protein B296_00041032 [Ensete ventricosum]